MGSYKPAADYGHRLLPTTIDDLARDEPHRPAFSIPLDDADLLKGYVDIDFATFKNAVDQLAWFIDRNFGHSDKAEAMAYLGTPDFRYHFLQIAAAKTGYQILYTSHSQSLAGHLALLEKCSCTIFLSASGVAVKDILSSRPMKHATIPELDDLLAAAPVKHYPYEKTFEEAAKEPYLILHTSGSTGMPKPIRYTHGDVAILDCLKTLPEVDLNSGMRRNNSTTHVDGTRTLCPFLHFHGVSSVAMMVFMVFGCGIYVSGFRHKILERNDLLNVLEHANVEKAFMSPAMIDDLAVHPDAPKYLERLSMVLYAGAALNHTAADFIAKHTYLYSQWGITESGKVVDLYTEPEDYEYCAFDIEANGLEFRHVLGNSYEMIFHRTPQSTKYVMYFNREPGAKDFRPGDLWTPHPDPKKAKNVWKFVGRTDDLITYQDGNNFHPTAYELKHSEHSLISLAALFGNNHRQPVLLLELHDSSLAGSPEKQAQLLEKIWIESVVPVNEVAPKNGQVAKTHILFAPPDKLFDRTPKGSIARKATLNKFQPEIDSIYQQYGDRTMDVRHRFERKQNLHNHQ